MKKIVGIIATVALATSVFAADIAAGTKIKGTLFSYDANKQLDLFKKANDTHDYANPNFVMNLNGDNAGAKVIITTDGADAVKQTTQTIWFKLGDAVKVNVGTMDVALNKEQIDWTESVTALGTNGYLVSINAGALAIDLGLDSCADAFFFSKADDADHATLKDGFVKFGYNADFGSIGAYVILNRSLQSAGWQTWAPFYDKASKKADSAVTDMDFGAGYKNTFGGVTAFLNVIGHMGDKFDWVRPEVYVQGSVDAFGYSLFAAPIIWLNSDLDQKTGCEIVTKLTYAIDGVTPYVYFKDGNILADDFSATIKLGANGSVGAMGWNLWLEIAAAEKCAFSMPVELTINF